jgi:hypothetical protein
MIKNKKLKKDNNKFILDIDELNLEIVNLKNENGNLKIKLQNIENENVKLNKSVTNSQNEIKDMKRKYNIRDIWEEKELKRLKCKLENQPYYDSDE